MKKYSTSSTNKLLIKYLIKCILTSVVSLLLFSLLFSLITYKFDLDLDINTVLSIFVVFLCSASISYISALSLKNNGALMGALSTIPFIVFCIINMLINSNSFLLFVIKTAIILLTGALFGVLATKKSNKFKVK